MRCSNSRAKKKIDFRHCCCFFNAKFNSEIRSQKLLDSTMLNYEPWSPRGRGGEGWFTPLSGLYRYVPGDRVWFSEVLDP